MPTHSTGRCFGAQHQRKSVSENEDEDIESDIKTEAPPEIVRIASEGAKKAARYTANEMFIEIIRKVLGYKR